MKNRFSTGIVVVCALVITACVPQFSETAPIPTGTTLPTLFTSSSPTPSPSSTITPIPTEINPPTPAPSVKISNVDIDANACWVNTGIKIAAGETVNITASGTVNTWGGKDISNGGPGGQSANMCGDVKCPLIGANYGALIGRVGEGKTFLVGSNLKFTASSDGELSLTINDWECKDNLGGFKVRISYIPIVASNERNGLIAFYTKKNNLGGISVISADGSGVPVFVSAHSTSDSKPSWSPDGLKIAFESLRDDVATLKHLDIYMMNADGSHLTRVTNTDGVYTEPEWSPDGKRLAVSAQKDGESSLDIHTLELATGELTRLTEDPASDRNPSWSPDGSRITFSSNRDGKWNVYIVNVKTGEVTQLTHDTGDNAQPDWSPDGEKLLFVSNRDGDFEVYIMDTGGENQTRLTNSPGLDTDPEWSPDGKYFAYAHGEKEDGDIYIMGLDDSKPLLLFENDKGYDGFPAWSAVAAISNEPVFGPLTCLRDANSDMKPDAITNTFSTQDQFPYIMFPYRNMETNISWSMSFDYEKSDMDSMNMSLAWKYAESGWYVSGPSGPSISMVGGAQNLKIQLYLDGEVIQEIKCPIVEP